MTDPAKIRREIRREIRDFKNAHGLTNYTLGVLLKLQSDDGGTVKKWLSAKNNSGISGSCLKLIRIATKYNIKILED